MNIATLAGHLAFSLIAFSFLVKDIFWLRIVSILASLFSVFYNFYIPADPMWLAINWNIVFILVNVYHIGVILYEKREVKMDDKNEELYQTLFKEMTPVEYLKISRAAQWETLKPGQRLITQGMPVPDLYLIYNGTVDVAVDGERIAELKDISTTKLTDQIEKRKILAENKIEQLVRDTNNSIKNYISSVAIEATRNILLQNLSKDKKSALIEESITEFNSVLKN